MSLICLEHNYFWHRSDLNLPCLALVLNTLDDLKHVLPLSGSQASYCSKKSWIRRPFRALQVLALSATKAFNRFPMHIGSSCKFLNQALKVLSDLFPLLYIFLILARRAFFPVPDTISHNLLFHPFPTAQLSPLPLSIPNLWESCLSWLFIKQ